MADIAENIKMLGSMLPESVSVVAVSKTRSHEEVLLAYKAGQRVFGENRVQELLSKKKLLPEDIRWHLIGHLQSNKVKQAVAEVAVIESVDSIKLLQAISDEALNRNIVTDCLLQVHIAAEETKFGFDPAEIQREDWRTVTGTLRGVRVCGLMGMASFTDNSEIVRNEFRTLTALFKETRERCFIDKPFFREISMGMSGDWKIAVEEGSTMIRVGTLIFGERTNKIL
ncbi:MAG TPA: YggS family pyridoxal phosphate-dependent enzyme [Bacteroidales bacterium]|nr:YggS family pyridoxal phosphate-dependent enzyme [Bacteroidales bacterium]